ncbi:MAG: hypothetical protein Q9227_006110 [Pyrenula ochraceoflavens]
MAKLESENEPFMHDQDAAEEDIAHIMNSYSLRKRFEGLGNIEEIFDNEWAVYHEPPSGASYQAWVDLFPRGRGWVSLSKIQQAGEIPTSISTMDTGGTGKYSVSTFHQIHCLWMLRSAYFKALKGDSSAGNHTIHCFAYLRRTIMCAADTALEPYKPEVDGVDGWGSPHMCRDYNAVKGWAERFRADDTIGV